MSERAPLIIDCHGHYTTAPKAHDAFREAQLRHFADPSQPLPIYPAISDDAIRESIETNQLRLLRERGADMTIFSPRASTMAHHLGDEPVSQAWTRHCNDLIARVVALYPETFIGVCQLPQSPGVDPKTCIPELEKCVKAYGFVGINLNPDPSGGWWTSSGSAGITRSSTNARTRLRSSATSGEGSIGRDCRNTAYGPGFTCPCDS